VATPLKNEKHLKTTEERLARLSVLQELTVTALDLFDPGSHADPFLQRVAERLGCLAALWVAILPPDHVILVGSAGLSEASRAVPFPPLRTSVADGGDPTTITMHYPELARADLLRWSLRLPGRAGEVEQGRHALLLFFDPERKPPQEFLPAMERLVGVLVTVLKHRGLAQDLRRSYEELERTHRVLIERERLAAIGELAAVVAHEVRNPLAVIFNCISGLEKIAAAPGDAQMLLRMLAEEANRLNQIVSELLDYARPGELLLSNESLEEVVASAIAAVKGAEVTPVRIDMVVPSPLKPLPLDTQLLRRAVINLVTNAVQVTPVDGNVVVRVFEDSSSAKPAACIEVTDTGPGMSSAVLARIFEPFYTTKAFGVGLGLSIVKHAAEAHRGEVTVRSREGKGTTFTIRLPVPPSSVP
jgi:signal transduction histidine kinase